MQYLLDNNEISLWQQITLYINAVFIVVLLSIPFTIIVIAINKFAYLLFKSDKSRKIYAIASSIVYLLSLLFVHKYYFDIPISMGMVIFRILEFVFILSISITPILLQHYYFLRKAKKVKQKQNSERESDKK